MLRIRKNVSPEGAVNAGPQLNILRRNISPERGATLAAAASITRIVVSPDRILKVSPDRVPTAST